MRFRWKFSAVLCLLLLALGLSLPGTVKAQVIGGPTLTSMPGTTTSEPNGDYATSILVNQFGCCDSTWSASREHTTKTLPGNQSQGTFLTEGFQGNIVPSLNGITPTLEFNFRSGTVPPNATDVPPVGVVGPEGNPCVLWVNCQYGAIPINLYNATDFTFSFGQVTTVDGRPSVTNNVTFNNIALDTYGHGASSVNIVINQEVTANLTSMKVKIGVYADLSNMHLYLPGGPEIPQGTDYSLNLLWGIDMPLPDGTGLPYIITGNTLYFIENNSTVSIADMKLGDNYVEMQGSTQTANHTAQVQFITSNETLGNNKNQNKVPGCNCLQTFPNLTYGVTTGVLSDPTLDVNHSMEISLQTIIFIVAVVCIAIVAVVLFFRHRKSLRKKGIKTVNTETAAQK